MPSPTTAELRLATLMFTDMAGSTQLKQDLGDREGLALIQRHHALVRGILLQFSEGQEINTSGDSFFLLFANPSAAVKFALVLQAKVRALAHETGRTLSDRIGIHVGEVFLEEGAGAGRPKDVRGIQVDTGSRLMGLATGGQILMTRFAFDNARQMLRGQDLEGARPLVWMNHGPYLLKGVDDPLDICEVAEAGAGPLTPPPSTDKARRHAAADSELVLGWRPALEQTVPGTEWVMEKKLGEGGFGEVWLGWHQTLKDRRVFKFCFWADRVRSLKREVTLFRVLKERVGQHPNIVGIHEVFFDEPPFYIVMDYAEAQDLKRWSEACGGVERIPLEARLEIVAQAADALQAAHAAGVIHREVKPSNILVSGSGRVMESWRNGLKTESTLQHSSTPGTARAADRLWDRSGTLAGVFVRHHARGFYADDALVGIVRADGNAPVYGAGTDRRATGLHSLGHLFAGRGALSTAHRRFQPAAHDGLGEAYQRPVIARGFGEVLRGRSTGALCERPRVGEPLAFIVNATRGIDCGGKSADAPPSRGEKRHGHCSGFGHSFSDDARLETK